MILFGILLACVIGLVGFVWIKLGARRKPLEHRNLKLHLNPALPTGKIVLADAAWTPLGETSPDQFDTTVLPPGCSAALLSTRDFAAFAARSRTVPAPALGEQRLRA